MADRARIVINGKFIGAGLNGVHRVADRLSRELLARAPEAVLLSPSAAAGPLAPRRLRGVFGSGPGWEQLSLPAAARGAALVNLCNLAPLWHCRSLVMIHDAQAFLHPEDYGRRQGAAYRALLPRIARRARRILTVSEFARQSLLAHGIGMEDRIAVLHNGADHILDAAPDPRILARHGLAARGFALTIGSAKGYKNLARLFDVFSQPETAGLPLVVAGGPPPERYPHPPSGGDIRFLGPVSDAELRALYEAAAMFLFPSRTEGFGLPPLEAMACGCPVISARAGAMPEILGEAALYADPDRSDGWAKGIAALRADTLASTCGRLGRAQAERYRWRRAGDRLWHEVEALLVSQPRRATVD